MENKYAWTKNKRGKRNRPLEDRLEENIFYSPDGCWYWTGCCFQHDGRGRIQVNGKSKLAYRMLYALKVGPVPDEKFLCHHCDNPICVNPNHLFIGDQLANYQDMVKKGKKRRHQIGEKSSVAKLNNKQVIEIRALHGLKNDEIGTMYGVSGSLISMIRNRRLWTHI